MSFHFTRNADGARQATVDCRLWDTKITAILYEEEVPEEYAQRCVEAMNAMPPELADAICRAAKQYYLTFCDEVDEDYVKELKMTVPIREDTLPSEILKCIRPLSMEVFPPEDPTRIGYQIVCESDWEVEHCMEIDILDDKLVFLNEYSGESPWDDHSEDFYNYANQI